MSDHALSLASAEGNTNVSHQPFGAADREVNKDRDGGTCSVQRDLGLLGIGVEQEFVEDNSRKLLLAKQVDGSASVDASCTRSPICFSRSASESRAFGAEVMTRIMPS
jgi:hypothetical protein